MTREEAIKTLRELCRETNESWYEETYNMAIEALSADRPTGEWVWSDEDASWKCGRCDCVFDEIDWKPNYNFCPNCGAKMRGIKSVNY